MSPRAEPLIDLPSLQDLDDEDARRSLKRFTAQAWPLIDSDRFVDNWHIDAICDHAVALYRRQIKRLIVNMPPRHGKSKLLFVVWPAWVWVHDPSQRFLTASYSADYAVRDATAARDLMRSEWYRRLITRPDGTPAWTFAGDQNQKTRYHNSAHGHRIAIGISGGSTGEGGDVTAVDDPTSVEQARSDTEREFANRWMDQTFSSRRNNERAVSLVVQQRQHTQDVTGHLLAKPADSLVAGWEVLELRTLFEVEDARRKTSIGWRDPRTEPGELLNPERFGPASVAEAKRDLGTAGFLAQHQQRPVAEGGNIIKIPWLRRWMVLPVVFDEIVQTWDCTFDGKTTSDWVVGAVWGRVGARVFLLDLVRGQWDIVETCKQVLAMTARWPKAARKIVEAKANGPAVIRLLAERVGGMVGFEPHGTKTARLASCAPRFEAGDVFVPPDDHAPWVRGYVEELTSFPASPNDDQVDATSMAIICLLERDDSEADEAEAATLTEAAIRAMLAR